MSRPRNFIDPVLSIDILADTTDVRLIFGIVNGLILCFTLIGCTFFLYLFYQERKHRKIAHNYVISMCCGDIVHGCCGCAMVIHLCAGLKLLDDFCPQATCVLLISVYISLFTLTSTTIDRYLAVCHPVKYQSSMSHNISYGIILIGWILAILAGVPLLYMRSDMYKEKPDELCLYISWVYDRKYLFGYLGLIMTICIVSIVFLYVHIYFAFRKIFQSNLGTSEIVAMLSWIKNQNRQENSENAEIGELKIREVKVTCLMFATVVSFILCWTPCIIILLSYFKKPNVATTEILATYAFPQFYSMVNPFFYAYTIKNVRMAFKSNIERICYKKPDLKENEETNLETV